ncbi:MAG TPA: hypothetical protein VJU61_01925 [Polyangiaceae bacterium]|nr:hypothetical protein [Polyangiaceae bacterium]
MTAINQLRELKKKYRALPEPERVAAFESEEYRELVRAAGSGRPRTAPAALCLGHCNAHCTTHCHSHCIAHVPPVIGSP